MQLKPTVKKAIEDYAEKAEFIEGYTNYTVLVTEERQIFVQFNGVPKRGSVTAWIGLPEDAVTPEPGDFGLYEEDEEPRTVGFLRNEIDDLDYELNKARTTLEAIHVAGGASSVPDYMVPFLKLTVANAEDLRRRLFKELEELTDEVLDHLARKNTN